MSIESAILGLLSWREATGYELKKIFENSSFMHWSGNNNQIYKALMRLREEGYVQSRTVHGGETPLKKIYSLTQAGAEALKNFTAAPPNAPECRKPFLVQLAWADLLDTDGLFALISAYEKELGLHLAMEQEKARRFGAPNRTPREALLWEMIFTNISGSLKSELAWVRSLRQKLFENKKEEEKRNMNYILQKNGTAPYLEVFSLPSPLQAEADALDIVALCGEHEAAHLLLHAEALSDAFFDLKTKTAGGVIQKFVNYRIKTAAVIPLGRQSNRFREWAGESNKGSQFGVFEDAGEAVRWLLK